MEQLIIAGFLAMINSKIIDYLKAPVSRRWPTIDLWWVTYVALVTGLAIVWFAGVNLFGEWIGNEPVGRLLSGVVAGGGSSLIYDVFSDRPASITARAETGGTVSADVVTMPAAAVAEE